MWYHRRNEKGKKRKGCAEEEGLERIGESENKRGEQRPCSAVQSVACVHPSTLERKEGRVQALQFICARAVTRTTGWLCETGGRKKEEGREPCAHAQQTLGDGRGGGSAGYSIAHPVYVGRLLTTCTHTDSLMRGPNWGGGELQSRAAGAATCLGFVFFPLLRDNSAEAAAVKASANGVPFLLSVRSTKTKRQGGGLAEWVEKPLPGTKCCVVVFSYHRRHLDHDAALAQHPRRPLREKIGGERRRGGSVARWAEKVKSTGKTTNARTHTHKRKCVRALHCLKLKKVPQIKDTTFRRNIKRRKVSNAHSVPLPAELNDNVCT